MQPVRDAYALRAAEYTRVCGTLAAADARDREVIARWADEIDGPIVDVGCGPGQWTAFLHDRGANVVGVDPVPEFIAQARRDYPRARYAVGHAGALDLSAGSAAGILAWFSLIHTEPDALAVQLDDLARALRPGGRLLLGYFSGPALIRFEHKVHPAWYWPTADLSRLLNASGFSVSAVATRTDAATTRTVGTLHAVRSGDEPAA